MALAFQYGSNTSSKRLNSVDRLNGDAQSLGLAFTVEEYDLDFTVWSYGNNCATADIVSGGGRQIWGVIYDVPEYLLNRDTSGKRKSFDAIEGNKYQRHEIQVCKLRESDKSIPVWTYTVIEKISGLKTSYEYAAHIIDGLRENKAPKDYIEYVKGRIIKNNPELKERLGE